LIRAWTLLLLAGWPLAAHEAPVMANVQVHLAAEGRQMRAVVRLPLEAVRDVDFPRTAEGFLDAAALAPRLDGLAKLWAADPLRLAAGGQPLGPPHLAGARLALPSDPALAAAGRAVDGRPARRPPTVLRRGAGVRSSGGRRAFFD
jgi:hypothetical protein